ncbi:MAG: uncharacterized protein K0R24_1100 [Gammaproteobacteria bacterium]|jgi:hypothetical protein|nr:uncharacterized protein [Gammaproteobacteria bacterium]MCE3238119.1 uncharacterized protein [Gammaproteobacteria bacterium]
MKHSIRLIITFFVILISTFSWAAVGTTRIPEFSNKEVNVWQTIIYPSSGQALKMHRHEYNRVVIPLNSGTLKVVNDQGKSHFLKLEKGHAYYLTKDIPGELHSDENISGHPITLFVIELK